MPRTARRAPGGLICHVLNRAAGRMTLFRHDNDYLAFLRMLQDVQEQTEMPVAAYCLMPNHWHLVLWPRADGDLARFMQRLTITHVRRWVEHRRRVGYGSVYQARMLPLHGHLLAATQALGLAVAAEHRRQFPVQLLV